MMMNEELKTMYMGIASILMIAAGAGLAVGIAVGRVIVSLVG